MKKVIVFIMGLLCLQNYLIAMQTYYEILGVPDYANTAEIKTAYRKLSLEWHSDKWSTFSNTLKSKFDAIYPDISFDQANRLFTMGDEKSAIAAIEQDMKKAEELLKSYRSLEELCKKILDYTPEMTTARFNEIKAQYEALKSEEDEVSKGDDANKKEVVANKISAFEATNDYALYTDYKKYIDYQDKAKEQEEQIKNLRNRIADVRKDFVRLEALKAKYPHLEENTQRVRDILANIEYNNQLLSNIGELQDEDKRLSYDLNLKKTVEGFRAIVEPALIPEKATPKPKEKEPTETKDLKLNGLIKILNLHIEKKINPSNNGEYVYDSKKFGKHPWLWFVFEAIQEVEKLKSFKKETPERKACEQANQAFEDLKNKILGEDRKKATKVQGLELALTIKPKYFIDLVRKQEEKEIDFSDYDPQTILSIKEDIESYRERTLFYCPKDIEYFAQYFSEQKFPLVLYPYLDSYRTGVFADIFYAAALTNERVFLKLGIPFYKEFFKRQLGAVTTRKALTQLVKNLEKTFNAWLQPTAGLTGDQAKSAASFNKQVTAALASIKADMKWTPGGEPEPEPSEIDPLVDALEGLRDKLKALARVLGSF